MANLEFQADATFGTLVNELPSEVPKEPQASPLASIRRGRAVRPRRILLYGVQGVGKSTWACSAPDAIVVPTEDGVEDLDVARFPVADTLDEFRANLVSLRDEPHDFKTVVVDSVDWLEKLVWADVSAKAGVATIADIDFGKGYTRSADTFSKVLGVLDRLRAQGMTVILVAHSRIEKLTPPDTDPYDKYVPDLHKSVSAMVQEWCDEVLFACYRIHTVQKDGDFGKKQTKALGGDRIIRTQEQPYCSAKCRLRDVPAELKLSWPAFAKYLS